MWLMQLAGYKAPDRPYNQIFHHGPVMPPDPWQQHGIATKLLSSAKGCASDRQKMFEQQVKLRKCQRAGVRRIPPLGARKGRMSVSEAEPARLFHTDWKGFYRLAAVVPADEKIFRDFMKPAEQRHSRQQHSVGIHIASLRRKLTQSRHPHHPEDRVAPRRNQ